LLVQELATRRSRSMTSAHWRTKPPRQTVVNDYGNATVAFEHTVAHKLHMIES